METFPAKPSLMWSTDYESGEDEEFHPNEENYSSSDEEDENDESDEENILVELKDLKK